MNQIFIQNIFVPDKVRFERNMESVKSLAKYLKKYKCEDLPCYFGGWNYDEENFMYITKFIHDNFKNHYLFGFDKNYGKAYVVNKMYESAKVNSNFKYIVTVDSDIVFDINQKFIFDRMEYVANVSKHVTGKPFGMLAFNFLENNVHFQSWFQNSYKIKNQFQMNETIVYPSQAGGIAGGALFISKDAWERVRGYRELGIYSSDDAILLQQIGQAGYSYGVAENMFVIHPFGDDSCGVREWKDKSLQICNSNLSEKTGEEYENLITQAENFWRTR